MADGTFIDTSGWASFLVAREPHHDLACLAMEYMQLDQALVVTSNFVLAELSALLISPLRISHARRMQFLRSIRDAPWVHVVHVDQDVERRSWVLMERYNDKAFSLVDCTSFVLMLDMGISGALTSDQHFEQAGFRRLLS